MGVSWLTIIFELFALAIFLMLSFIFSGSEVAFFSLSPVILKRSNIPPKELSLINSLLKNPERLLATILLGNTTVNSFASSIFTTLMTFLIVKSHLEDTLVTIVEIVLFTVVLLVIGEVTPKLVALNKPVYFSRKFAGIIKFFDRFFGSFNVVLKLLSRLFPENELENRHGTALFDEIAFILSHIHQTKSIEKEELYLIDNTLSVLRGGIESVMIPVSEVLTLPSDATVKEALGLMRTSNLDFVMVFDGSLDNISGVVTPKTILQKHGWEPDWPVKEVEKKPTIVADSIDISTLWKLIRHDDVKLAVVVDEHGTTVGVVYCKALFDKLMGENTGIKHITDDTLLVDGDVDLSKIEFLWGIDLGWEGSVAGFLMEKLSRIPREGEIYTFMEKMNGKPVRFEVLSEENGKIKTVRIQLLQK